jgi:cytidine deaminase
MLRRFYIVLPDAMRYYFAFLMTICHSSSRYEVSMRFADIISEASKLVRPVAPSEECSAATVASSLISGLDNIYTGVCMDFECGIGFCAEHAAVAEMLKRRESKISMVVAVNDRDEMLSPCGRCHEMMWQLDPANKEALVVLGGDWALPLRELLPYR